MRFANLLRSPVMIIYRPIRAHLPSKQHGGIPLRSELLQPGPAPSGTLFRMQLQGSLSPRLAAPLLTPWEGCSSLHHAQSEFTSLHTPGLASD
jgi:hypothetical protein